MVGDSRGGFRGAKQTRPLSDVAAVHDPSETACTCYSITSSALCARTSMSNASKEKVKAAVDKEDWDESVKSLVDSRLAADLVRPDGHRVPLDAQPVARRVQPDVYFVEPHAHGFVQRAAPQCQWRH
jgi:hypothetical protein